MSPWRSLRSKLSSVLFLGAASIVACGGAVAPSPDDPDTLCGDMTAFIDRCGVPAQYGCVFYLDACGAQVGRTNATFASAFRACAGQLDCTDNPFDNRCVGPKLDATKPTDAQVLFVDAMCRACEKTSAVTEPALGCHASAFSVGSSDSSLRRTLAVLSDDAANDLRGRCIARAASTYPDDYANCETDALNCVLESLAFATPTACLADAGTR